MHIRAAPYICHPMEHELRGCPIKRALYAIGAFKKAERNHYENPLCHILCDVSPCVPIPLLLGSSQQMWVTFSVLNDTFKILTREHQFPCEDFVAVLLSRS